MDATPPIPDPPLSRWRLISSWLVAANIFIFVANALTMQVVTTPNRQLVTPGLLFEWGNFNFSQAVSGLQLHRFISFQFLHNPHGIAHIAFNLFMLWMLAPIVEKPLGARKFLLFYLACGAAGPVMLMLQYRLGILFNPDWAQQPLVGASAGVFGVMVAAAYIAPDDEIELLFPPIPMLLRQFVSIMLIVACVVVFGAGYQATRNNAGGEAAHLGGALAGFLLIRHWLPKRPAITQTT
jgi:membrane associated rhomboid family serine protease